MLEKSVSIVLGSSKSSTYPAREKNCSDSSGLGECYVSGFDSPAALLGKRRVSARQGWVGEKPELFEHLLLRQRDS
jgi:hypothetical protein